MVLQGIDVRAKELLRIGAIAGLAFAAQASAPALLSAREIPAGPHVTLTGDEQSDSAKTKTFLGTIAKKGDQFILMDETNKNSYLLDDQETAEKFAGKKVRVKGVLDATNSTIRIQAIEIAAA